MCTECLVGYRAQRPKAALNICTKSSCKIIMVGTQHLTWIYVQNVQGTVDINIKTLRRISRHLLIFVLKMNDLAIQKVA